MGRRPLRVGIGLLERSPEAPPSAAGTCANRAPHEEPPEQQRADAQADDVQDEELARRRLSAAPL